MGIPEEKADKGCAEGDKNDCYDNGGDFVDGKPKDVPPAKELAHAGANTLRPVLSVLALLGLWHRFLGSTKGLRFRLGFRLQAWLERHVRV